MDEVYKNIVQKIYNTKKAYETKPLGNDDYTIGYAEGYLYALEDILDLIRKEVKC